MRGTDRAYKAARRLRKEMSLPEVLLWQHLRRVSPRFRRQHPIGPFVLDFYCPAARLAVEVDGFAHDTGDRPERDVERVRWLEAQGLRVVRLRAGDVIADALACAEAVVALCQRG